MGLLFPLGIIYEAANNDIQSSRVERIEVGKTTAHVTSFPLGWTDDDIGVSWREQVVGRSLRREQDGCTDC